jgi:signal transduction histidine kinase/CheY-like chemotaxis protein
MLTRATSSLTVTLSILLGTIAALIVILSLSVIIYRAAVRDTIADFSSQQLATLRTAAVGMEGEMRSLSARLHQFASLPSVQNVDVAFLGPRIRAAFGGDVGGLVQAITRIDAEGVRYSWQPDGKWVERGRGTRRDPDFWKWTVSKTNKEGTRITPVWWRPDSPENMRALTTPVWRTASSGDYPKPPNDFNGLLAIEFNVSTLVDLYLGPSLTELAEDGLIVGLAGTDFGLLTGPGSAGPKPSPGDPHDHQEPQGTSLFVDETGQRLHAWAKLTAGDQTWLIASSAQYDRVAAEIQRSAAGQLSLVAALLVFVPAAGWLMLRRERRGQDEQRQLERQLAESQKMEAIGKLAGGVAHDFNNMLTAILGYSSLLTEDPASTPIVREHAHEIRRAAESAAQLTQKLLAFSRRQVLTTNEVDLVNTLGNVIMLLRRLIGENIAVSLHTDAGLWSILGDPAQVEQSIINLAINSRDAMPDGGRLEISARNAPMPGGDRRADGDVKPGDYVRVSVKDNGAGMDEATRRRMFEPFFTTKPFGRGTGLGLSTVYGFVKQCGGHVAVQTAPGQGTTVELLLPRATAQKAAQPFAPPAPEPDTRGRETVLVVEDEDAVRALASRSLKSHGYRVLAAANAEEAMRTAEGFGGVIHLLLTDVVMPGMKGPDLAAKLRALRPDMRVILMSGYAADVVTRADLQHAAMIAKPFVPRELATTVREVLDRAVSA